MWTKELIAEAHKILAEMLDEDIAEDLRSWANDVDRQGGSFTDAEINARLTGW